MRAYMLGAGASFPIYPLGGGLFDTIDETLISDSLSDILYASKKGAHAVRAAESKYDSFKADIGDYRHVRKTLLWAMEAFFLGGNDDDFKTFRSTDANDLRNWSDLRRFGALLKPGDVVITFNYDSTVERVLHDLGKWAPSDG